MSLKNKIAFLGLGQCGGNIAATAQNKGFLSVAINTSEEDLKSVSKKGIKNTLLLGNTGGCGKERKLAKNIIKEEYEDIISFMDKNVFIDKEIELVYVAFSAGGGTGSGFGPIVLSVLQNTYEDITFAAIVVMPEINESSIALYNNRSCFEELYTLNIPILIPDNNKASGKRSREKIYSTINDSIVNSIEEVIKDREPSEIANLDSRDTFKLLKTAGVQSITITPLMKIEVTSAETLAKAIKDSFENNNFAPLEYDKKLKRVGFIFEVPKNVSELIDYDLIMSDIGINKEVFEGIYTIDESTDVSKVITILTGLSYPETRIEQFDEAINNAMDKEKNISALEKSSLSTKNSKTKFESFFDYDEDTSTKSSKKTKFSDDDDEPKKKVDVTKLLSNF
jgi:cell division GTPase FtsZ